MSLTDQQSGRELKSRLLFEVSEVASLRADGKRRQHRDADRHDDDDGARDPLVKYRREPYAERRNGNMSKGPKNSQSLVPSVS